MLKKANSLYFILFFGICVANAQNLTKSPYSALGIGDMHFGGTAKQSAMGQLGQNIRDSFAINSLNPASYGALRQTVLEAGALYSQGTISTSTAQSEVDNYSFGYFKLAFPVSTKWSWGMGFGLEPYSNVGYNTSSVMNFPEDTATLKQVGTGGLSRFYGGTGIALFKGLSLGFQASYIFGTLESIQTFIIPAKSNKFNLEKQTKNIVGDFQFQYSLQYQQTFKTDYHFVVGASFWQQSNLNTSQEFFAKSMGLGGLMGVVDTIAYTKRDGIKLTLPNQMALGFGLAKQDNWFIGVEGTYQAWSDYRLDGNSDSLKNNIGIHIGASYTPNILDYSNYFKRIEYRAGFKYDNGNMNVNGKDITNYLFSVGAGLPLGKVKNKLNLSFEYLIRGTHESDLIKEEYFRFVIGITVSDKWFNRYKYD